MFARLLGRGRTQPVNAEELYQGIVAQARLPALYRDFGVPDTVDGRFEMIVLHALLLFRRLKLEAEPGQQLAQAVFDTFLTDMDRSLREMGVGDLGVPKRMKTMGRSFYGRLEAYGEPLSNADSATLAEIMTRNLAPEAPQPELRSTDLANYAIQAASALETQPIAALLAGGIQFPVPVAPTERQAQR